MSKLKRKVTVDAVSGASDDRKKPSVFERLGPGAVRRQVGNYDDSDSDREEFVQRCRNWVSTGSCPYGNKCKFLHGPYTSSKHKGRREDEGQEDLRLRVKQKKHKGADKSDSDDSVERSRSRAKKDKIAALKSAIIKKKGIVGSDSESPSQWSGDDLDFKKELELEKRRQQLQREISRLEDEEDIGRENFIIEKKLMRQPQRFSSSESDSSDERSRSRSRKAGKKKKKRNKHSRSPAKGKALRSPSPSMDSDEPHKKHKKKSKSKKHRDSMSDGDRSPEPEQKTRKLLSPLKFKKSTKAVISKTIMAFHSEDEDEAPPPPKMNLPMPSRSPLPMIPNIPILQRSRSSSSEDDRRIEKRKDKRSITPVKKKKERKMSPEYVKETKPEKGKSSKRRTKSRSISLDRSLSFSPDAKKSKKLEKKKKQKKEELIERSKDSSFERSRGREVRDRDLTPSSDYRDFSPGQEVVKKKKDKKKDKKKKERDLSLERDDERKHKKEKLKERERSESPVPTRKQEKRSLDRASRRELVDTRTRSPSSSKGSRDTYQDRRGRSPEPPVRGERERDISRDQRDREARDPRDIRDPRDRDARDPRGARIDPRDREARGLRESRPDPREVRDPRELREPVLEREREIRERELREREARDRDPRDRDPRDRDPRELRDPRDIRDPRELRDRREPIDDPRELRDRRDPRERDLRERPGSGREFERDMPIRDPRDPSGDRRERYPDDRYRDDVRRDRYDDPRYPPPPPGSFDDRGRYGRGDREGFPDAGDRGPYGRPDRERDPGDRRDMGDRREPVDMPFDRYGPARGDPRYGPMRGRGHYDYRDQGPGWDRGRGRGRGWGRGGPERGGRYDDRSRRGDWDNQRRQDDFYGSDRRDWQDRREENRRDDRREGPRDDSRDKRDEKTDSEKEKDVVRDKDIGREPDKDRKATRDEKKEDKEKDKDKKEDRLEKEDSKRKEQDLSDVEKVEKKEKKKDEDRPRERKDEDRKDRVKEKDRTDTRSKDSSGDRKRDEERRKDDEPSDRERSRKRRASNEGSRSPSLKKARDGSPALSTHSKKSSRDGPKEREPDADIHSDKGSVADSERSKKADSERSRHRKSRKDEEKRSKKGSDTESLDRKRSRSRSKDGSDSGDSKRRKLDLYQEGVGQLAGYVIKDTVGSDREDNNLDNIEQNFSDWSDNDSDDDILNRPGEASPKKDRHTSGHDRDQSPHGSVGSKHSEKSKEGAEGEKEKKSSEDKDPDALESISSDEGSLVEHVKFAAVDALEIDWASMVKDERPKLSTGSALQRFKPGALFAKMGISRQYAGEELYKEVLDVCQRHQEEETACDEDSDPHLKSERQDSEQPESKQTTDNIKNEPNQTESSGKDRKKPKFEFLHDVAMFHSSALQKLKERKNLLSNIGPFRRALCARRDLEIRRQLCKVDKTILSVRDYSLTSVNTCCTFIGCQCGSTKPEIKLRMRILNSSSAILFVMPPRRKRTKRSSCSTVRNSPARKRSRHQSLRSTRSTMRNMSHSPARSPARRERSHERFVWVCLSSTPVPWPAEVKQEDLEGNNMSVFISSDNAIFEVKKAKTMPFSLEHNDKIECECIETLKKKQLWHTLEAFQTDYKLASDSKRFQPSRKAISRRRNSPEGASCPDEQAQQNEPQSTTSSGEQVQHNTPRSRSTSPDSEIQHNTPRSHSTSPDKEVQHNTPWTRSTSPEEEVQPRSCSTSPDGEIQHNMPRFRSTSPDGEIQHNTPRSRSTSPDEEVQHTPQSVSTSSDEEVQHNTPRSHSTSPDKEVQHNTPRSRSTSPDKEVQHNTPWSRSTSPEEEVQPRSCSTSPDGEIQHNMPRFRSTSPDGEIQHNTPRSRSTSPDEEVQHTPQSVSTSSDEEVQHNKPRSRSTSPEEEVQPRSRNTSPYKEIQHKPWSHSTNPDKEVQHNTPRSRSTSPDKEVQHNTPRSRSTSPEEEVQPRSRSTSPDGEIQHNTPWFRSTSPDGEIQHNTPRSRSTSPDREIQHNTPRSRSTSPDEVQHKPFSRSASPDEEIQHKKSRSCSTSLEEVQDNKLRSPSTCTSLIEHIQHSKTWSCSTSLDKEVQHSKPRSRSISPDEHFQENKPLSPQTSFEQFQHKPPSCSERESAFRKNLTIHVNSSGNESSDYDRHEPVPPSCNPSKQDQESSNSRPKTYTNCSDTKSTSGSKIIFVVDSDESSDSDDSDFVEDSDAEEYTDVGPASESSLREKYKERDVNLPNIYIRKYRKSHKCSSGQQKKGTRVYDNYHACLYCGVLRQHIRTHLISHRKKIPEVKELLEDKSTDYSKIRKLGDHKHNVDVLKKGNGEVILSRRPATLDVSTFGPCPECKEWVLLKNIKQHYRTCTVKKIRITKGQLVIQSQVLAGVISSRPSKLMLEEVFPRMLLDEVSKVAKNDHLIVALGESWLRRSIDNRAKRRHYASEHMRLMAKLLMEIRKEDPDASKKTLNEYISTKYFEEILTAVLKCCVPYMDDLEELASPSNAIKLKYDVRRIVNAKWALLVKRDPHSLEAQEMQTFLGLISLEWGERLTKLARAVLVRRRFVMKKELPTPDDIAKLSTYTVEQLKSIDLVAENYFRIVQLAQTRLLTYNKRRSGEIDVIGLDSYAAKSKDVDEMDNSLVGDLTKVELHLLKSQEMMTVRGKGTRPVPVLIPQEVKAPLEYLASFTAREAANVQGNQYLFPNKVGQYTRAYESLKKICSECNLVAPGRITSVSMRKYTATFAQVLNLDKYQVDWLCRHLGHSSNVHKTHYRHMSGLIERVEMAKLFLVQDLNLVGRFKGKKLNEIDVSDIVFPGTAESEGDEAGSMPTVDSIDDEVFSSTSNINADVFDNMDDHSEEEDVSADELEEDRPQQLGKERQPVKKKVVRQKWDEEEIAELNMYFSSFLVTKKCPRKNAVELAKKQSRKKGGKIWNRTNDKIIKKISNMNHK